MPLPEREQYAYHSRYCEENIWLLAQQPEFANSHVIVIAAQAECFPILCQRAAAAPDQILLWDYHVVLMWQHDAHYYLVDFDTTLAFCTPLADYFEHSFWDEARLNPEYVPRFRVLTAQEYVRQLRSDRRHMQTDNGWLAPPPPWPPISATESNLPQFADIANHDYGQIFSAAELLQMYANGAKK